MKNIIKSVSVIVGAVVGAGFASGQEIYSFFNVYNENGLVGIIISSILLGFIIYKVLVYMVTNMYFLGRGLSSNEYSWI